MSQKIQKSLDEWQKQLNPEQFRVCRKKGTEKPFTGEFWDHDEKGVYICTCCGNSLFSSETKFDSGTGWPSFYDPNTTNAVALKTDKSLLFRTRTEVLCSQCDAHLGHVFDDGPEPTGKRYCINSIALGFKKE